MRPPFCDVCGVDVDPDDPASLEATTPVDEAPDLVDLPGHPAHQRWLCVEHREPPPPAARATISFDAAVTLLRSAFDRLVTELELVGVTPEVSERREWMPIDNVLPPESPYVDFANRSIVSNGVELTLAEERAYWNADHRARASVTLSVRAPQGRWSVAVHLEPGGDQRGHELFVRGDAPPWLLDAFEAPSTR